LFQKAKHAAMQKAEQETLNDQRSAKEFGGSPKTTTMLHSSIG